MADTKISAATDISSLVATDKLPVARVADATPYFATMAEIGAFTGTAAANAGALSGLALVYNTTTVLSINLGTCSDSLAATTISFPSLFTKSISGAWASGSGANGMGVGLTATASTWYHVFAVMVAGVADAYFDNNIGAANKPAGTTAFRRIGSIRLNASAQITQFAQNVDRFDLATPVLEFSGTPGVTTAVTQTLGGVPSGVNVEAILVGSISDIVAGTWLYISSTAQSDVTPNGSNGTVTSPTASLANYGSYAGVRVVTNASAQVRRRVGTTTASVSIATQGWVDTRGRG